MIDAKQFLAAIFEDKTDEETICVSKMIPAKSIDEQPGFWNVPVTHGEFQRWNPDAQAVSWYFCVSTMQEEWNERDTAIRRKRSNILKMHCLVLDDIGTKSTPPPVEPNWKIETSEGNFQWGYLLEPTDDVETYEAFVSWCADQGWGDKGAGGAYRIMRVPGSANLKPGRSNFRSRVTMWDASGYWTLEDLIKAFGHPDLSSYVQRRTVNASSGGGTAADLFDPVLGWLQDSGHVVTDDGGEFVTITCPWGDAHTSGNTTASYSPLGRGDGDWSYHRVFNCFHDHCQNKKYVDFIQWAQERGAVFAPSYDPLPYLQDRYAFVINGSTVVDLHQRPLGGVWELDFEDWGRQYPGKIQVPWSDNPVPIKTVFLNDQNTRKIITRGYVPNAADIVTLNQQEVVNTYVEPQWPETDVIPVTFLEHVDYLLPDERERECFLDWLAYKVQHPASRSYAILMVAKGHGTGRGMIRQRIARMLQGKVNSASFPQLIGRGSQAEKNYNDWVVGCQFVVVDEVRDNMEAQDFYHGYETFKSIVDTRTVPVRVNPKFGRTRDDFAYFNLLIFSNHDDALVIPEEDRRVAVFTNPDERRSKDYYERIEKGNTDEEAAALYWWLRRRDVTSYDHVYPPETEAKVAMISVNRSHRDELEDLVIDGLPGDLVTRAMLTDKVRSVAITLGDRDIAQKPESISRQIWRRIGSLRPRDKHGARYTVEGEQQELRAVRGKEEWKIRDKARDKQAFMDELTKGSVAEVIELHPKV